MFKKLGIKQLPVLAFLFASAVSFAQVAPATQGGDLTLRAGAEYSNFQPDFGANRMGGVTAFFDLDNFKLRKLGIEGEARWLRFNEFFGETESFYLAGPRYRLYRFHDFSFYAKVVMGGGFITFPKTIGSGSYFAYAPGGTVEYRLSRRLSLRGDYEYNFWPSAPNIPPNPSNGMTPNGYSGGVSYRIF